MHKRKFQPGQGRSGEIIAPRRKDKFRWGEKGKRFLGKKNMFKGPVVARNIWRTGKKKSLKLRYSRQCFSHYLLLKLFPLLLLFPPSLPPLFCCPFSFLSFLLLLLLVVVEFSDKAKIVFWNGDNCNKNELNRSPVV